MAFVIDSHGMLWRHDALEIGGSRGSVLVRGSSETRSLLTTPPPLRSVRYPAIDTGFRV